MKRLKRWIGDFVYDFVIKYIGYLDDDDYDRLIARIHRPAWTRRVPFPKATGQTISFYKDVCNEINRQTRQ